MARTPQDPQVRITEILDTTEHLFATKGYRGTTISDIAKKMGVAQGMFYYYFKSKEEILEALLNRHTSALISEIKDMAHASNITPPHKMELMIATLLHSVRYKDGLLIETLYDDQNLHIKDKVCCQAKQSLTPWLLKIIEEGVLAQYFHISHPTTVLDFILAIIELLIVALYEKMPADLLSFRLQMAEVLIEKALGAQEKTIHISL
jgi:AcrR family transcriptional regulator